MYLYNETTQNHFDTHINSDTSQARNVISAPPQLAPFDEEKWLLYPESLLNGPVPHPISEGEPRHHWEEAHFRCCIYCLIPLVTTHTLWPYKTLGMQTDL